MLFYLFYLFYRLLFCLLIYSGKSTHLEFVLLLNYGHVRIYAENVTPEDIQIGQTP